MGECCARGGIECNFTCRRQPGARRRRPCRWWASEAIQNSKRSRGLLEVGVMPADHWSAGACFGFSLRDPRSRLEPEPPVEPLARETGELDGPLTWSPPIAGGLVSKRSCCAPCLGGARYGLEVRGLSHSEATPQCGHRRMRGWTLAGESAFTSQEAVGMYIPKAWARDTREATLRDGRAVPISAWGWGDDQAGARAKAAERLQRALERIQSRKPFPHGYEYEGRPLREDVLQTLEAADSNATIGIVTRNRYGAHVLNAEQLLFLDIDLPSRGLFAWFRQLFSRATPEQRALVNLREALRNHGGATFRIYRTASGFRVMAVDRSFDPTSPETQDLMRVTRSDPAYARLCRSQKCFRARLTPKPWRCGVGKPPGEFPRSTRDEENAFAGWLREYEQASTRFATCRYLETIGSGRASGDTRRLQDLHDRVTRCEEPLPLA